MTNDDIASILELTVKLMDLHEENPFKSKSYASAAYRIEKLATPLEGKSLAELQALPELGKTTASVVDEILRTGTWSTLQELLTKTPKGILEMMRIKGLGPKKVKSIWTQLNIETPGELLYAIQEQRLSSLKGFGEKTQADLEKAITFFLAHQGKFHYAEGEEILTELLPLLNDLFPGLAITAYGHTRRKTDVLEKISIAGKGSMQVPIGIFSAYPNLVIEQCDDQGWTGSIADKYKIEYKPIAAEVFYKELWLSSSSEEHQQDIKLDKTFANEAEIYSYNDLAFHPAECREFKTKWDESYINGLVQDKDIRGVIHNHSTYSDGKNTVEEMAMACKKAGYEYLVMSDHSQTAAYAGGMGMDKVFSQFKTIDQWNAKHPDFRIYKSVESDILTDGSLDYTDEELSAFDLIIVSVHAGLKMDEATAMQRLIRAIEHPSTRILGHMTGRLLLSRPGYPIDHKKIIDACAANKVAIEINASPYRLDIDWRWLQYAQEKGVWISINPDAHSIDGIQDIHWGVISGRKGGLLKSNTLNALDLNDFEDWRKNFKK